MKESNLIKAYKTRLNIDEIKHALTYPHEGSKIVILFNGDTHIKMSPLLFKKMMQQQLEMDRVYLKQLGITD